MGSTCVVSYSSDLLHQNNVSLWSYEFYRDLHNKIVGLAAYTIVKNVKWFESWGSNFWIQLKKFSNNIHLHKCYFPTYAPQQDLNIADVAPQGRWHLHPLLFWGSFNTIAKKCKNSHSANNTLSGRTCTALARHSDGRVFAPHRLQQVKRFLANIYTVQYVDLRGYCPV